MLVYRIGMQVKIKETAVGGGYYNPKEDNTGYYHFNEDMYNMIGQVKTISSSIIYPGGPIYLLEDTSWSYTNEFLEIDNDLAKANYSKALDDNI